MAGVVGDAASHDVQSLLSSPDRDFLIRNNGDQVKVDSLTGKKIGLYFSASWCHHCQGFTPTLVEVYNELSPRGDLEIIFISADDDEESFSGYFYKMPWLAIPFSDLKKRDSLKGLFKVGGMPHLVILDGAGATLTGRGVQIVLEHGVEGHPFTPERIMELKDQEEAARRNQSLTSLLVHGSRDFVVSSVGNKVPATELEGKTIGLYFSLSAYISCADFTPKLLEVYEKLKAKGESFEIVQIPLDDDEASINQSFGSMPWFSLPLKDKKCEKLVWYFELSTLPTLVIIGRDGKTLHSNIAKTVEEHGVAAYPFTPEKFAELAEIEKKRKESQTLESILVSGDLDFVIGKEGTKIPVSDLVGKTVLLYFSAHWWCPPCCEFMAVLTEAYEKIKATGNAFEVIFISSDKDQTAFDDYFAEMPWLALPFGDERKKFLSRKFEFQGIPMLVAIGPTGQTVTKKARDLILVHGADAYPFTAEHLKKFEEKYKESIKGWPKKLKRHLHEEHELVPAQRRKYICDGCDEVGKVWSYYCEECDFDLHPKCAVGEEKATKNELDEDDEAAGEEAKEEGDANSSAWLLDRGLWTDWLLAEIEKKREESQTLESILVSGDLNFIIGKEGTKISVSDLVGKTVLLYFSAHWCPPCRAFLPVLTEAYEKIKATDDAFEVIFISSDKDQTAFDDYFAEMPWLALPFGDERKKFLSRKFKVQGIPMLVAIDPTGRTVTNKARDLIMDHGADAYPFTAEHLKKFEEKFKESIKGWPEKLKHPLHEEHELVPAQRRKYVCDGCDEVGEVWSYYCEECDFDLHPKCAVGEEKATKNESDEAAGEEAKEEGGAKEGWVCDGEVCHKA